jgi:hypothetical protein
MNARIGESAFYETIGNSRGSIPLPIGEIFGIHDARESGRAK